MPEKWILRQYQALPLDAKIHMSQARIREWYEHFDGNVVISFSGGKDSTVLAHVVHEYYPKVPLVFVNTGLEYPEIQSFARKMGAEFVRPKMQFSEVISTYGYPIISKENAEAIHYARKIRNSGGQRYTEAKRIEFLGERQTWVTVPPLTDRWWGWKTIIRKRTELQRRRVFTKDEQVGGERHSKASHSAEEPG